MSFQRFAWPWAIALALILSVESIVYAIWRPNEVDRNDFLIYPIQRGASLDVSRWIIWEKMRHLLPTDAVAVQVGDSSGFFGIMPEVVSRYLDGPLLNLSCCGNTGFDGYLAMLEAALRRAPRAQIAIVYIAAHALPNSTLWRDRTSDQLPIGGGHSLPVLGQAIEANFTSPLRWVYPPSNFLRPWISQYVLRQGTPLPDSQASQGRWGNPVWDDIFLHANTLVSRAGYMVEYDMQTPETGRCRGYAVERSPTTGATYLEMFAREFVGLAERYHVTPVLAFQPSAHVHCDENEELRTAVEDLRRALPVLRVPFGPMETWPDNIFSTTPHVQRGFAVETSRRLGRALYEIVHGRPYPLDPPASEPATLRTLGSTATEQCGYQVNFRSGYYADFSGIVAQQCDGQPRCTVQKKDLPGAAPPHPSCRAVYRIDFKCGGQPVRSIREEGEAAFDGRFKLDCARDMIWATDPMPYGIQMIHGTYAGDKPAFGNVTLALKGHCDGLDRCRVPAGLLWQGAAKRLDLAFRCGTELTPRALAIEAPKAGDVVDIDCRPPAPDVQPALRIHAALLEGACRQPARDVTFIAKNLCDGAGRCDFQSVFRALGSPPDCDAAEFDVSYSCGETAGSPVRARLQANRGAALVACPAAP
jgi:hypothetical protein